MVFEHQSRWILALERGEAALPTPEEMRADIEAKQQWIARYYNESPRHTIEEEHVRYLTDLGKGLRAMIARARSGELERRAG